jgi:hypothetical protein
MGELVARLHAAIKPVLPYGFRGKVQFVVDKPELAVHDITVVMEFRPVQPKAGQRSQP